MCLSLQPAWSPPRTAIEIKTNPQAVHAELVEAPRGHAAISVMGVWRQAIHRDELFREIGGADRRQFGASKLTMERALRAHALQRLLPSAIALQPSDFRHFAVILVRAVSRTERRVLSVLRTFRMG